VAAVEIHLCIQKMELPVLGRKQQRLLFVAGSALLLASLSAFVLSAQESSELHRNVGEVLLKNETNIEPLGTATKLFLQTQNLGFNTSSPISSKPEQEDAMILRPRPATIEATTVASEEAHMLEPSLRNNSTVKISLMSTTGEQSWKHMIPSWLEEAGQYTTPPNTAGALIHLGKTGGSTISHQLRNGCHSWVEKPCHAINPGQGYQESYVSKLATYYHTPDFHILNRRNYKFFVVTTRDPLSRTLSAFAYMHPRNKKARGVKRFDKGITQVYEPCFPTVDTFVEALGVTENPVFAADNNFRETKENINITDCRELAKLSWQHQLKVMMHFFYDLQHVARQMNGWRSAKNDVAVLVVRQEALWEDWISANEWLGQKRSIIETFPYLKRRSVNGTNTPVSQDISETNRATLCLSLRTEYKVYLDMIKVAVNLNDSERLASLERAKEVCPELNLSFEPTRLRLH